MNPARAGGAEGDTIAAIATAAGGGIGVVRWSGPAARAIAAAHWRPAPVEWVARRAYPHGTLAAQQNVS